MLLAVKGSQTGAGYSRCGQICIVYSFRSVTDAAMLYKCLYSKPNSFLALVQTDSTCGVEERSDDRITPRYLKVSTHSSGLPSRNMGGIFVCFLFRDTVMYLHLEGFKVR